MNSRGAGVLAAIALLLLVSAPLGPAEAAEPGEWAETLKISGNVFGDAYYVAANHDDAVEGQNGFWFRRLYFTVDKKVSETVSSRIRLEASSPGDFTTSGKMTPAVKDLYVRWKVGKGQSLYIGLAGTPTWALVEKVWGLRAAEKTALDLHKYGSSRDIGLGLKGSVGDSGVDYHVVVGNGNSNGSETNTGKKVMASVAVRPVNGLVVEAYGDYEDRTGAPNRRTLQAFAALTGDWGRVGVQAGRQTRGPGTDTEVDMDIGSVFVVLDAHPKASIFGRVVRGFDPSPGGSSISYIPFDDDSEFTFLMAGVEIKVDENVSFIPNVEIVAYDEPAAGAKPDADFVARTTFFFRY